jgi:mono/diheme cytochrome c family protein
MRGVTVFSFLTLVVSGFWGCTPQRQAAGPAAEPAPAATGVQQPPPSIWEGVFSQAQARRGEEGYRSRCAGCHGPELVAKGYAVNLTGPAFTFGWQRKTIANRFLIIRETMPPNNLTLSGQEYVDIVSYILEFNGYPAGEQELEPDLAQLARIVIEPAP